MTMTANALDRIISHTEGRFVTISFVKKNGDLREITGRIGVKHKGQTSSHRQDSRDKMFFLVFSPRDRGFRRIDAEKVVSVKVDGLYIFNEGLIKTDEAAA